MEEKEKQEIDIIEEKAEEAEETTETEEVEEQKEQTTEDKIAELEAQCADYLDKYQRCFAEFDNFRKRTLKEKASMYDDGVRGTVEKLLPVIDNLERAVAVECHSMVKVAN